MTYKPLFTIFVFACLMLAACQPTPASATPAAASSATAIVVPTATLETTVPFVETSQIAATEPESAQQWSGTITGLGGGAQFDDYFTPFSGATACGIDGENDEIRALISQYRDSGKSVKISGQLQTDVPDYNGCQIRVSRIEVE